MAVDIARIRLHAKDFGKQVRELEDKGDEEGRSAKREEWCAFRNGLPKGTKTEAVIAYYDGYCK